MKSKNDSFTIFYAWQDDLPAVTNRQAIRAALRAACSTVEKEIPNLHIKIVEATRGAAGSPNIPLWIQNKIKISDAFICDISTINRSLEEELPRTPNPNVVFELGFALAYLGWERIIMLFNKEYGDFPKDVPFDFDRNRITPYALAKPEAGKKQKNGALEIVVTEAVRAIVRQQPPKPLALIKQTPEEIKRQRDMASLKYLMENIHIPTIDDMIIKLPRYIDSRSLYFWEGFNGLMMSSTFHVYDPEIRDAISAIHAAWKECVSHDDQYHETANPDRYAFSNPGDLPLNAKQEKVWNKIEAARLSLRKSLDKLLNIIRERFIDIDIPLSSRMALKQYVDFYKNL